VNAKQRTAAGVIRALVNLVDGDVGKK
jgi:hypothetical protein